MDEALSWNTVEESTDLIRCPLRCLVVNEVSGAWGEAELEVGKKFGEPVGP